MVDFMSEGKRCGGEGGGIILRKTDDSSDKSGEGKHKQNCKQLANNILKKKKKSHL